MSANELEFDDISQENTNELTDKEYSEERSSSKLSSSGSVKKQHAQVEVDIVWVFPICQSFKIRARRLIVLEITRIILQAVKLATNSFNTPCTLLQ